MEFEKDNINVDNYPTLSKSEVKNVLLRCQQLLKTSSKFQNAVLCLSESWQEFIEDLDKLFNLKEMYFISNILNSNKDVQYIISENKFYSQKLREMNDFLSNEFILPIKGKTDELQKKVSNKKVEKALKHESKSRKKENFENPNSNTKSLVQKSIFNNNYEIFQCVVNSSNKLINHVDHLFSKPQISNLAKHNSTVKKSRHKKSYSNANPSDIKAIYNNNNNMSINNKSLNKTYNNNYNLNTYQNSKLSKHSSIIDNTEHAKLEKNFTSIPNYNDEQNINGNADTADKDGPISPLNNELHLDFGVSEIKNQNNQIDMVITSNDRDNNEDEIIISPPTITSINNELAQMNDAYKFMKKQQRIACHNRSHSVGADPFNNNSIVTQEKYLSLINGSAMPNNISSLTMDSPFNQPSSTTNIDTSSKIPSLTSIVDTPPVSGSTPSLEITQSKIQPPTNSHILNMLSMTNNTTNKRFSSSYLSSSNLNNASSLNISEIENPYNKMINDDSFCENQSFSISQSTIIKDNRRKSIENDSLFDNDISFDNGVGEVINIDDKKENLIIKSENADGIDINDINLNNNCKSDENEIIYIKENEGEQITKIEVVEIIENEIISQNIENTTEIDDINDIENELESEIINEIDLPNAVEIEKEGVLTKKIKEKEKLEEVQVVPEEFVEKGNKSDRIPILQTEKELASSKKSKSQQDDPKPVNVVKSPENLNVEINPEELNKPDLNIDSVKTNEKNFVKRSKSINIFKSHERSRSLTDMRFDKKYILGIIFNKKDSNISRRNSSSSIKRSNSNSNKSVRSNSSRKSANGSHKESFKSSINLPEFNCNKFIKSNSPFIDNRLQRRHSISSPEKTILDYAIYNKEEKKENIKTTTIPRSYKRKDMETQYIHNELKRTPIPIEKDNERISIGEIQSSLFNISSLSGGSVREENEKDYTSRSQSSKYSSTSSQLRKERLRLGKQFSPTQFRRNNSITKPISPNNYKNTQIETEKPQLNHPITTTPILENAMKDILNKDLSDITVTDKAHSFEKHSLENQDKIPMENLSIYNSSDIKNIPNYTNPKIHRKNKEDNNYPNKDSLDEEDDNSNGSIMALINKNWKLLNDDYSENENVVTQTSLSQKSDNNNKFVPLSNEFVAVDNEYHDNFNNNNNNNNYLNNSEYIKCMDNLGNPFLNPNNALEISENEAYKGKAVVCSPSIEVESIIGSILYVNDTEEDTITTEKFEYDDDDAFKQDLQKHAIYPDDKINEDKENMNYNIINNPLLNNNINNEKDVKSNNIVSNVTSFRKFSLPTSNLNKPTNSEKKYLQRSKSGGKYPYADNLSPLSNTRNNYNNINSENNSSSVMGTGTTVSSKHKNKNYERIIAVHDYKGRDRRELSMEKGDVLIVKQKKGTWIYGIKESNIFKIDLITNQKIKFEHREHGWVPITYVKPYNKK